MRRCWLGVKERNAEGDMRVDCFEMSTVNKNREGDRSMKRKEVKVEPVTK